MEHPVHRAAVQVVVVHHLPAERLVGFQARRRLCRADARDTLRREGINNTCLKGSFRPDEGICCPGLSCKTDYIFNIGLLAEMDFSGKCIDAGVASGHHGIDLIFCIAAEGSSYRMLASSPAHNEYLHHSTYRTYPLKIPAL